MAIATVKTTELNNVLINFSGSSMCGAMFDGTGGACLTSADEESF